ncbi:MAG: type II secretion system protein GspM, partial [Hypericibacter sp.]
MSGPLTWLSRAAAIALLLVLLGSVYFAMVRPVIATYRQNEAALMEAQEMLSRFEQMATSEGDLQRNLEEVGQRQASQGYYLTTATDALAAAELQDRVKTLVK